MDGWTAERVQGLAPDAASAKAGLGLAGPRKWVSIGREDNALWGECQGSGKTPYRSQVDLTDGASKCSCPSRKFPCKHSLGLLLLHRMSRLHLCGNHHRRSRRLQIHRQNFPAPYKRHALCVLHGHHLCPRRHR